MRGVALRSAVAVSPRPSIMSLMKKAQSSHVLAGLGFGVQSPDRGLIGIA